MWAVSWLAECTVGFSRRTLLHGVSWIVKYLLVTVIILPHEYGWIIDSEIY
jgi:hypothetical protein